MKTLIAIPCMDTMPEEFVRSLLYLEKGEGVNVCFRSNSLIYDSRNILSITAIEKGFDRVLWLDSDMVFQPDTLKRLAADIDGKSTMGDTNLSDFKGCDMVTGLYFKRRAPHTPVIFSRLEKPGIGADGLPEKRIDDFVSYPKDSMFTVSGCGFGCCMTSVKLLKAVWDKFGPAFSPLTWAGEDIAFCYRVKQLGYDIWCDSRVKCGHIGSYIYTEDDFLKRGETK